MSELQRFAAAILAQWRSEGGGDAAPIDVSVLLDRVLPYRMARRMLGIDISEDYEALMLRLLAEEGGFATITPSDAAELAREELRAKLPELAVLQLLRSSSIVLNASRIDAAAAVDAAPAAATAPIPPLKESPWAPPPAPPAPAPAPAPAALPVVDDVTSADACWACFEPLPVGPNVKFCPFCGADQRQPTCNACGAAAQIGWKHCAECGAKL